MDRKQILAISVVVIATLFLALTLTALMPLWLIVLMIRPSLTNPLAERLTTSVTKQMMHYMMKGMR